MARRAAAPRRPLTRLVPLVAGVAAVATVATLAVVFDGYDAQEVPALSTSVWVTRDAGQYARVNTELAEIDTVRSADDPDGVVQNGDDGVVFTGGLGRAWVIDPANPLDLGGGDEGEDDEAASGEPTPSGTRDVVQSGSYVAYLTNSGRAYLGVLPVDGEMAPPMLVDPYRDVEVGEDEEPPVYIATAVAVDEDGLVALYSADESAVRLYDAVRDSYSDPVDVPSPPAADAILTLTLAQGRWALFDADSGSLWLAGRGAPVATGLEDGVAQIASATRAGIHLADGERLIEVDAVSGEIATLAQGSGLPARPTLVGGDLVAAWVSPTSATLWTASDGRLALDVPDDAFEDVDLLPPVIRSNGDRAVLNETASGMLWRIPDGAMIPLEQWSIEEDDDRDEGTIEVDDIAEQEPPVAEPDTFGVRPGELVTLPVLLNDHDPNQRDVLTIVPESIVQPGDFGVVTLAANNQQAVVRVTGSGSATFQYAVTDGVSVSPPTSVTLTVVGDDVNSAPEWCGVQDCVQEWPSPGISAGGTVTVPVLSGWVDREGDVIVLADATKDASDAPVTVVATSDGDVVVRHQDPNAADALIPITVTVADARGATATRTLEIRVTGNPALVADPIAAVAGVGETVTVDVAEHVRGGSGAYTIVDAVQTSSSDDLVVVPNAAGGTIDLSASTPGDYVVTYTVQDLQTQTQQSALLRFTVVGSGAPLSIAPITAFVRPNEDTTVDVLAAVQNTTGRVLLVSQATSSGPELSASVVAQSRVRVSGSTADGTPGRIGTTTVTVTDGAGGTVDGTITVFLVAPETAIGPIAVPDTATVRAGAQADIPVLANDVSPRGERLVVHPDLQGSGTSGELAFVAADRVRYLAPEVPGVYALRYSVFLENSPQLLDSASITVTVLPPGTNRDPQPPILTARVVAGQSVAIPFSSVGVDPDGDRVVLADVTQPDSGQGIAEISAEGDAIVYTAPGLGVSGGQVAFAYRVRDAEGATAEGLVRVGVLATDVSDVAPVTYGDYARVQAGTPTPLTVQPLLNDRDPLSGRLELLSVVPNAPADSPEYARLEALLDTSGIEDGEILVTAGDVQGVHSYVYTVESQVSFSTAEGLIVVNVSDAPSPDAPIVTDTVVTAQNRGQLASGLDVVSGKVQWASGDTATLDLALWGPAASRYTVEGWRISGDLPSGGDIVPFSLTGAGAGGSAVVTFGFLRIPAFDDMRIQLRADVEPVSVREQESASFEVRELLDLVGSDDIEIRADDAFAVQRANSSCVADGTTGATYTAGREAPWTDTCTVPVRIEGQSSWTMLGVPLLIEPRDPLAILTSISRTIAPNATESIDLYGQMTSWEGGRVGDIGALDYDIQYGGSSFVVTQSANDRVEILTLANARPGTRETIVVETAAFGGLRAAIQVVVGIAAPDAPRGANFTQRCEVTAPSCVIAVVDRPGEYDPFAGNPADGLTLVSVGAGGAGVTCPVATVRMSDARQVTATWPAGPTPLGGECVVGYTVADAQGRTGQGQLTLDVYGYPQRPASVTTVGYTATTVDLLVTLGDARNAHPAVDGVAIYEGSTRMSTCTPSGPDAYRCTVTGMVNGVDRTFTARASNSIGESLPTSSHTTHSYDRPTVSNVTVESVYAPDRTSDTAGTGENNGVVRIRISADDDVREFRVMEGTTLVETFGYTGAVTERLLDLAPGAHPLQVIPVSQFTPPSGGGTRDGDARPVSANAVGSPRVTASGSASPNDAGSTLTLSGMTSDGNFSPEARSVTYYVWYSESQQPQCRSTASGGHEVTGALVAESDPTVGDGGTAVPANREYYMAACVSYGFGAISSQPQETFTFAKPAAPQGATVGVLQFWVGSDWDRSGNVVVYDEVGSVEGATNRPDDFTLVYRQNGSVLNNPSNATLVAGSAPNLTAEFCKRIRGADRCSDRTTLTPGAGSPDTAVRITLPNSCTVAQDGTTGADIITTPAPAFSSGADGTHHTWDRQGDEPGDKLGTGILDGAPRYDLRWRITWTGYSSLGGASDFGYRYTCVVDANAPDDPPDDPDDPTDP